MSMRGSLYPLVQKFFEHSPEVAAASLDTMDEEEALKVLRSLPPTVLIQVFRHLPVAQAARFLTGAPPDVFQHIVEKIEPGQGAEILISLSEEERHSLIEHLPEKSKELIREMLEFPENSAGRIMTTNFLAFNPEMKVREAIKRIRTLAQKQAAPTYVYVVDAERHLAGVINMRDLMIASGTSALGTVMRRQLFTINAFMDREEVANLLSERRYFAAPVVDSENRMLGVVKADQLLSQVQAEATEDIQKMFGAGGNERVSSTIRFSLAKRLPWLHVNLGTAFLAAAVVGLFEDVIARVTVLAVFLPVVAGQGGNAGAQSLAIVMRGLVMREIPKHRVWRLILKETWIGTINGVVVGTVTGIIAWVWHGNMFLGIVIGLAMIVNLLAAGFSGAAIPLTMKAVGLDPAQSSNIVLTTITDVVGFFAFLGFAVVFESYLA